MSTSLCTAADSQASAPKPATNKTETSGQSGIAAKPKAVPKVKLVDINSAKKAELKTLPGVSDAEADKIIGGRPYGSKAHLLTHNIVSAAVYDGLKGLVIAKQPTNDAGKNAELYKNKK
ncbi:helix-hairpin-helix domain-containing protein [Rhodoferax sp.]|uniref:ComEA family DNA-binding protein n=1 Tax=Rhodoferax sp. TaxID=50421 RepID=UPI0025F439DF|nr:helix-hairpin-helix domain-containing protein [Rhodoferax sp.]MCM2297687.1 helix-hairpin-helix domain-containing protein [Rhodoferax sp.]